MKWFRKLERRFIPKLRHSRKYIMAKMLIVIPFALPTYFVRKAVSYLIGLVRIKRKNKPDIVLENIIDGWKGLLMYDDVTEELAIKRAKICSQCPSARFSTGVHTIVVDNRTKHVRGLVCGDCGCPLSAKIRTKIDHCPQGKW